MTEPDSSFSGTSGNNLPEPDLDFSCKYGERIVHPETVVDIKQDDKWVRIPVTEVTEWINKDGPADMTRTAKIKFPFEWGDQSIIQYINGFNSQNNVGEQEDPYDECRVFFYDHDLDEWVTAHYGYVGGVGPASDSTGVGKFWVYDPADLMKGIQVSKSWDEPSISTVTDFVLRGTDSNGKDVGIENRSVFENEIPVSFIGKAEVPKEKQEDVREVDPEGFAVAGELPVIGSFRIPVPGLVGDIFESIADIFIDPLLDSKRRFQLNRHNMVDLMDWFADLLDARWWFEPAPEGPVLCIDASAYKSGVNKKGVYERRYFVDEAALDDWYDVQQAAREEAQEQADAFAGRSQAELDEFAERNDLGETYEFLSGENITLGDERGDFLPPSNYNVYATVDTLNNSALADIKPFNTMYLYGESVPLHERYGGDAVASPALYTEKFPWVKVTYEPLIDRAGGYKYSAQPIESDKIFIRAAKSQARKEFRKHLAEETEGSLEIQGEPHLMPYDYLVTQPTCNDTYINANAEPITYEVNGVKHVRKAGEKYTTEVGVSLSIEERLINVEAEYKEA
jgi:hypothetical protein